MPPSMPEATGAETISGSYAAAAIEPQVRTRWDDAGVFHVDPDQTGDAAAFCILIPPPNVTAALHLGHALNNTIQDVLVRWHRMRGDQSLWMPGTDHAGIATQTVVERRLLQQEGVRRTDLDRDDFVARVAAWKDEYESIILTQLSEMGASCDFDRTRFTMDDVCAAAVRAAFFRLFDDGLIYRGKRLVNWDPVTGTALADDEVEMEEVDGHMWYLRYPLEDGDGHVTVATTRPETMLGDTAVAIHPDDPRAEGLRGRSVRLPLVDRLIPIVEDAYVVMPGDGDDPKAAYATGFLKVTPAHDPNDWEIGQRHDLAVINVTAPDARISADHGWDDASEACADLVGLTREEARDAIVTWFKDAGLLEEIRDYRHSVGHSYRSHVPIEPYLSDQWYVRVSDDCMRGEALRALAGDQHEGDPPQRPEAARDGDGGLRFHPDRYAQGYQAWHEQLRDWCISRQLWWGHRIPAWSRAQAAGDPIPFADDEAIATHVAPQDDGSVVVHLCVAGGREDLEASIEADGFVRDEDVLDTWFSSALWPISTMGWPDPGAFAETAGLLDRFNPSSVLCTGRDIITLWVSRMVMFNRYFRDGTLPFTDVYIHPMIQDGFGQRMSKSLGNGVDPRDIIATHGADAMRFTLAQLATSTQDVRMPVDLICPHSGETVHPKYITNPAGHKVMAPRQTSSAGEMVTTYGILSGEAEASDDAPLATNTSERFDAGRNFANKFWNAARFALANITNPAEEITPGECSSVDQWMCGQLAVAIDRVNEALLKYHFSAAAEALYDVVWRDFCDWYLEAIKPTVRDDPRQQRLLLAALDTICRLLHPICPFITEAIWPYLQDLSPGRVAGLALPRSKLVATAAWPVSDLSLDEAAIGRFGRVQALVTAIRGVRSEQQIPPRRLITLHAPAALATSLAEEESVLAALGGLTAVVSTDSAPPPGALVVPFEGMQVAMSDLHDTVDLDAERGRLADRVTELTAAVAGFEGRLANEGYIANAPEEVVQETRDRLAETERDLESARNALSAMGDA